MGRSDRYAYMGDPRYNPPNQHCPECDEPSKIYFVGSKTIDGAASYRYKCEHLHEWRTKERIDL